MQPPTDQLTSARDVTDSRETPPVVCISAWFGATDREILTCEIDDVAAAVAGCYEELSPVAKASAVKLAHTLANLRRNLVAPNADIRKGEPKT